MWQSDLEFYYYNIIFLYDVEFPTQSVNEEVNRNNTTLYNSKYYIQTNYI